MLVCTAALAAAEDTNTIDRFKIFNDGDVLLVPVEGNVYSFTIDTGFAKTAFDPSLVKDKAKDTERLVTATGKIPVQSFPVRTQSWAITVIAET